MTSAVSLQLLTWLPVNSSILKKIAVRSSRAPLCSANLLSSLVRSPLKQTADFLADVLIAAFEHDLPSRLRGALEFSEAAREGCTLSSPLHLLGSRHPALLSPPAQKPFWRPGLSVYVTLLTVRSR